MKKHGRHWIRLHFFPFVHGNYDLSTAKFSVSAQDFTLLRDFQPKNDSVVEYSLNIISDKLVLKFTPSAGSFAFLNALEIISLPDLLIPESAGTDVPLNYQNFSRLALETVARVNMGNQTVLPQNDSLWRLWLSDERYISNTNIVKFESNISAVNFSGNWPTQDTAPSSVYGTATRLDSGYDPNYKANATWFFQVDPGFQYLVRFHFCNILNISSDQLYFNVYINSWLAVPNLNVGSQTSNVLGAPFYMDFLTSSIKSPRFTVSIGPSTVDGHYYPDALLNGLEIMKLSDSSGNLAARDSEVRSKKKVWVIIVGIVIGILFIAFTFVLLSFLFRRKRRRSSLVSHSTEDQISFSQSGEDKCSSGTAIISSSKIGFRFPIVAIQEATDNFSESLVIGVGGFGKVYKGVLRDGTKVAVKRGISQSQQGLAEFRTEIEMLSQFRHRHLVSLIGYCHEQNEMVIVYEYMEKGTLKIHLYGSDLPRLSWRQRLEICIGTARGLHYLHTGSATSIIHRDIKSANILLDENLKAKVADFGISKIGPQIDETHVSTVVRGSFGYLDPEYLTKQQLTEKSDVYSFGVVMLEVLCGRPVIDPSLPREMVNLVEWAMEVEKKGEIEKIIDIYLKDMVKSVSLRQYVYTAVKCLAECGIDRPPMGYVLWNLEYALQLQGNDESDNLKGDLTPPVSNSSHVEISDSITEFGMGSMGDLAGISMSRVFSQMVKAETSEGTR
ncbi:Non-specific serine/threonine protein kinase [Bertholletia excelsa]